MKKADVVKMLIAVARAARNLADGTCEHDDWSMTVDPEDFALLSSALDALDELPEPAANIVGTGPAKAEAFFRNNP